MTRQVKFRGIGTMDLLKCCVLLTSGPARSVRPRGCSAPGEMLRVSSSPLLCSWLCPHGARHCNGLFRWDEKLSAVHRFHWGNKRVNLVNLNKHGLGPEDFLLHPAGVPPIRKPNPNIQTRTETLFSRWPCWCYSAFAFRGVEEETVHDAQRGWLSEGLSQTAPSETSV